MSHLYYFKNQTKEISQIVQIVSKAIHTKVPQINLNYFKGPPGICQVMYFKNMRRYPRNSFKLLQKQNKSAPEDSSNYFKNQTSDSLKLLEGLSETLFNQFRNKSPGVTENFVNYFKKQRRGVFDTLSKYSKNQTQGIPKNLSNYFKNKNPRGD